MVRPWDILCTPLLTGTFDYQMTYVMTPAFTFYREAYTNKSSLKGIAPPGVFAFSVPIQWGSSSTFWNYAYSGDGLPCMIDGGLDVVFSQDLDHFVVLISLELLERSLPDEIFAKLKLAAASHFLPSTRSTVRQFAIWLLNTLNAVSQNPQTLQHHSVVKSLEQDLIQMLVDTVDAANPSLPPVAQTTMPIRERALNKALGYLYGNTHKDLTVEELSRKAGASLRTLEYAFRESFDMTPRQYLRLRRLHAVRLQLLATRPSENRTINKIAFEYGFYELGRFAGYYKQVFGELPSATLKKTHNRRFKFSSFQYI